MKRFGKILILSTVAMGCLASVALCHGVKPGQVKDVTYLYAGDHRTWYWEY